MLIKLFKCQMCGARFEVKVLDREDAKERYVYGSPVRCERCNSTEVEPVRTLRRQAS
jgi:DNA-directed RNA polymerase subunit RPC12/RpoP